MTERAGPDMQLLLAHSAWIRSLARRLVGEGAGADDLVQETWLAALEHPPAAMRSERGWLAGVLANIARQARRGEARLRMRERRVARGAEGRCEPSAADTFEAASTGRELADLVLALEEPFRTAILLRYYEDLPPRRIAKRLDVPVRTVNSRLARGLERLRERWKLRHRASDGDGDAWARSLWLLVGSKAFPVAPAAAGATGTAFPLGVVLMNAKVWLGVAVIGTGAMTWWLTTARSTETREPGPELVARAGSDAGLEPSQATEPLVGDVPEEQRRSAAPPQPVSVPVTSEQALPAGRTIHGRVLDADAVPLRGVEVEYRAWNGSASERPTATSGPNGAFELDVQPGNGELCASDPRYVTVMSGRVREHSAVEPLVVVAPRIELAGIVVDGSGAPLSEVRVRFEGPSGFSARFEAVLDATEYGGESWRAETGASGEFELAPVPWIAGARLVAELEGFEPWSGEIPWNGDRHLVLTLARRANDVPAVTGRVVDPEGRPVAGAWVSLGARSTATDSAGEFRLERDDAPEAFELRAMKSGHRMARLRAADDGEGKPVWPPYVILELGAEPLSISGRVVDAAGKPRPGMSLWIHDPTPFGILQDEMLASVEYYLGTDEPGDAYWASEDTDARGRFRLAGLLEREYSLRVMNKRTLEMRTFGPFRAGEESAEIVFEDGALGRIAGSVVAHDGSALAGVSVRILGNTFGGVWSDAASTLSDERGGFAFDGIAGEELILEVSGDDVVPEWFPTAVKPGGETTVELSVSVRCTLQVDLGSATELADALRVLDGNDAELTLFRIGPTGSYHTRQFPIVAGRSDALGVDDSARTLVLMKGGAEVRRVPIELRRGELNLLTP